MRDESSEPKEVDHLKSGIDGACVTNIIGDI
jgi:hypothetical protein